MKRARVREINDQMVDRLLAREAEPMPAEVYALRVLQTRGREAWAHAAGLVATAERFYVISPDPARDWARNLAAHLGEIATFRLDTSRSAQWRSGGSGSGS
jgi:proteasome lid subunit RPN8/RPN11